MGAKRLRLTIGALLALLAVLLLLWSQQGDAGAAQLTSNLYQGAVLGDNGQPILDGVQKQPLEVPNLRERPKQKPKPKPRRGSSKQDKAAKIQKERPIQRKKPERKAKPERRRPAE